jgi:cytochrome c
MRRTIVVLGALALTACGQASDEPASPEAVAPPAAALPEEATASAVSVAAPAPASFAQCRTCHQVAPGKHGIGPSLAGIQGAEAGAAQGYAYSAALKSSGLTWDDATLDRFLEAPMATVPGTKMVYPGLKDPAKRAAVIAYLKTL